LNRPQQKIMLVDALITILHAQRRANAITEDKRSPLEGGK
jgi:hypothetical protein